LIRLAIRCRRAEAEAALAELLELAPGGIEEVSDPDGESGIVEYAIYGAPGELPELGELQAAAGGALVGVRSERVPDDWTERWKRFYHPVLIAGRLYVRPPWERPAERGGVTEVVIDPGRAFGTGTHATTSMCLELLLEASKHNRGLSRLLRRRQRRSLCDLGCGSGVLAIAAAKLGFAPVLGVDSESAAIDESDRNARLNYVELELRKLDLRTEDPPRAGVVTANLTVGLLEQVADAWVASGASPEIVVASGLLTSELDRALASLKKARLHERRRLASGDWSALLASVENVLP
jgi:ribosomal protein L11 methyltransferase